MMVELQEAQEQLEVLFHSMLQEVIMTPLTYTQIEEVISQLVTFEYSAIVEGVPEVPQKSTSELGTQIFCRIMKGSRFASVILLQPISRKEVQTIKENLQTLNDAVESQVTKVITRETTETSSSTKQGTITNLLSDSKSTSVTEQYQNINLTESNYLQEEQPIIFPLPTVSTRSRKSGLYRPRQDEIIFLPIEEQELKPKMKGKQVPDNTESNGMHPSRQNSNNTTLGDNDTIQDIAKISSFSGGNTKLDSLSTSATRSDVNLVTKRYASSETMSNLSARTWADYLKNDLYPRIIYGTTRGNFLVLPTLFTNSTVTMKRLELAWKSTYYVDKLNQIPPKVTYLAKEEVFYKTILNFQIPLYYCWDGVQCCKFTRQEILGRTGFSQLLNEEFAYMASWLSTKELSTIFALPKF